MTTASSSSAVRRLRRDLQALQQSGNEQIEVRPSSASMLEWHFLLHNLPQDSPYAKGCYHGKLMFSAEYPNKPPKLVLITPNGKLLPNHEVCLTITTFMAPEWSPTWSLETLLVGLISFIVDETEEVDIRRGGVIGAISLSRSAREALAEQSWEFNSANPVFQEAFQDWCGRGPTNHSTPAQVSSHTDDLEDDGPVCSFCLEAGSERLIHPCRCRGTMAVHSSCLLAWVQQHRQSGAYTRSAPQCSVCLQRFPGVEERPGLLEFFAWHRPTWDCWRRFWLGFRHFWLAAFERCLQAEPWLRFLRAMVKFVVHANTLVLVCACYAFSLSETAYPGLQYILYVYLCRKIAILVVSYPPGVEPPLFKVLKRWLFEDNMSLVYGHRRDALFVVFAMYALCYYPWEMLTESRTITCTNRAGRLVDANILLTTREWSHSSGLAEAIAHVWHADISTCTALCLVFPRVGCLLRAIVATLVCEAPCLWRDMEPWEPRPCLRAVKLVVKLLGVVLIASVSGVQLTMRLVYWTPEGKERHQPAPVDMLFHPPVPPLPQVVCGCALFFFVALLGYFRGWRARNGNFALSEPLLDQTQEDLVQV
eukprot:TRINITY_DN51735_c0_g1_i2.p1 TRINITY_DN51735_c0_g1~~TRINITY_DN51735_c0_g1_i2.p1  ORF type:complete len:592 (+),score=17.59 TRINITY_DN51735_c0_g1_i2:43-1818(+)